LGQLEQCGREAGVAKRPKDTDDAPMAIVNPISVTRPYSRLAPNYDATVGIPFFRKVRQAFEKLIRRYGITFRTAADIGCGTGLFARYLNESWNVPVFGVDISRDMLRIAARNCRGVRICLLRQDIRALRLPHPVDLITCNFDTLNHLVKDGDLARTFRSVRANLNPDGHFIFDMLLHCGPLGEVHRYGVRFQTARRQVTQYIRWDPTSRQVSILVSIRSRSTPRRILEVYRERAYSPAEIGKALLEAGFVIRGIHDATTLAMASHCQPRIIVVARKKNNRG
jgi:SAM-dependent methyltransferase